VTLPEKPRIAAELRLRVTSSGDPTSFESGSDLLKLNGQPWSRPLCVLSKYYKPLYEKLREDRLVPDDFDTILSTLTSGFPRYNRSQLLYTLNDTFIVGFRVTFNTPMSQRNKVSRVTLSQDNHTCEMCDTLCDDYIVQPQEGELHRGSPKNSTDGMGRLVWSD
jgi:hypothetical protein